MRTTVFVLAGWLLPAVRAEVIVDADFQVRFENPSGGTIHHLGRDMQGRLFVAGRFSGVLEGSGVNLRRFNADASRDTAFRPATIEGGEVLAVAQQIDGRILIAGNFSSVGGQPRLRIARLHADGALDTDFAPREAIDGVVRALLVQADGRILIGGDFRNLGPYLRPRVARLQSDGTLDPGFRWPGGGGGSVRALLPGPNGTVYAAGLFDDVNESGPRRSALLRMLSDGSIDPAFFYNTGTASEVRCIALQSDGKLLVGSTSAYQHPGLVRIHPNGAADAAFAVGSGFDDTINDVDVLPDGRVVVTGSFRNYQGTACAGIALLRADASREQEFVPPSLSYDVKQVQPLVDGTLAVAADNSGVSYLVVLGLDGRQVGPRHLARSPGRIEQVVRAFDGGWFVRGSFSHVNGILRGPIVRLRADHSVDEAFFCGEEVHATLNGMAGMSDGGLLVISGDSINYLVRHGRTISSPNRSIVRFGPDGTIDAEFTGKLPVSSFPRDVGVQANGRVIVVGQFWGVPSYGILCLKPDGTQDATFAAGAGFDGIPSDLLVEPDDRIVVLGAFTSFDGQTRGGVVRLFATGAIDPSLTTGAGLVGYPAGVTRDGAGNYLIWGMLTSFDSEPCSTLLRLKPNGTRDTSFVFDATTWSSVWSVAVDSLNRPWLAGPTDAGPWRLAVLDQTGSPWTHTEIDPDTGYAPIGALKTDEDGLVFGAGGTDEYGQILSGRFARLAALAAPRIVRPPSDAVASPGETVVLSVEVEGNALAYQWFRDGEAVVGATGAELRIPDVTWEDAGTYVVRIASGAETTESVPVRLSGRGPAPVITTQPGMTTGLIGRAVSMSVAAQGAGPLTYQWRRYGMPVSGATSATLHLSPVNVTDEGSYDVVVADGLSATVSAPGRLFVTPATDPLRLRPDPGFQPRFEADGGEVRKLVSAPDLSAHYLLARSVIPGPRIASEVIRLGVDGTEDRSFSPPGFAPGEVTCAVVQTDGKLILGGSFTLADGISRGPVVRLNRDGSLDTAFSLTGISGVHAVAVEPDGKILVAYRTEAPLAVRIGRFSPDGSPVRTQLIAFGGEGRWVSAMRVTAGGKLVVAGDLGAVGSVSACRLARYEADGVLDSTFTQAPEVWAVPAAVQEDAAGRLLLAHHYGVIRLLTNGALDAAYRPPTGVNALTDIVLLGDGSILAAGEFYDIRASVVRINSDGNIIDAYRTGRSEIRAAQYLAELRDGGFLFAGRHDETIHMIRVNHDLDRDPTYVVRLRNEGAVRSIAVGRDGRIVVAGDFSYVNGVRRNGIARLFPDGSLDPEFAAGSGFSAFGAAGGGPSEVYGIKIDAVGRVIVVGAFEECDGAEQVRVARLLANGRRDPSFAWFRSSGGYTWMNPVRNVDLYPDGRIWVAGWFTELNRENTGPVARLLQDGARDPAFSLGSGYQYGVQSIMAWHDGRVVVSGGLSVDYGSSFPLMVRLLPSGARDPLFVGPMVTSGNVDLIHAMPDGRLVYDFNGALHRISMDGSADTSFSNAGNGLTNVVSCVNGFGGTLFVGGLAGASERVIACRLLPDGRRDASFGVDGYVSTQSDRLGSSLAWADDGSLLAGRYWTVFEGFQGRGLVRLVDSRAPSIRNHPASAYVLPGEAFSLRVDAGEGATDYQWYRSGVAVAGATGATLTIPGARVDDLGTYTVRVINAYGSTWSRPAEIRGLGAPPVISREPDSVVVDAGQSVALSVGASADSGALHYQWQVLRGLIYRDIPGATASEVRLESAQAFDAGSYRVTVASGFHVAVSEEATVTVRGVQSSASRLLNLSTRALCLTGDDVLIPGFYISGASTKRLLVRAVGPELTGFGVPGAMVDPQIVLKRQSDSVVLASNEDWGQNANWTEIRDTAAALYAFPLTEGSKSAALLVDLPAGGYTIVSSGHGDETGVSIVELYDASSAGSTAQLINISNRGYVGVGGNIMIPGFVVSEEGSRTFLIRAVGPTLGDFGVPGVLADPKIEVYKRRPGTAIDDLILTNDTWGENGDAAQVRQTATAVFAFGLTEGSKDAAFVVTLPPGSYTVNAKGVGETTGVALVEVYLVP